MNLQAKAQQTLTWLNSSPCRLKNSSIGAEPKDLVIREKRTKENTTE
jgi:hypothetical protein